MSKELKRMCFWCGNPVKNTYKVAIHKPTATIRLLHVKCGCFKESYFDLDRDRENWKVIMISKKKQEQPKETEIQARL